MNLYKKGSIRDVTYKKYQCSLYWIKKLVPDLKVKNIDRATYQNILNKYAMYHEKQTVMDFHHHLKASILDAIDDGLLEKDPTRRVIINGKLPSEKKCKFLSFSELKSLIEDLHLGEEINYDYLILLVAKTGLRFSEALGLTPNDFDFKNNTLSVNKTWDYKNCGGFVLTKNTSSNRKISIDNKLSSQFKEIIKNCDKEKPIFIKDDTRIFNSTVNSVLSRHCKNAKTTEITIHGLRHTHASVLLYKGVSLNSVSKRLGHSNTATTQKVYLHIIQELANKDNDIIENSLSIL